MSGQLFILLILIEAVGVTAWADTRPSPLQIYVYNQAGVPQRFLLPAEQRTGRILRLAGVETRWLECTAGTSTQDCAGLLPPETLVVHIIHDSRSLNGDIFGAAFLGLDGSGNYADVFYDRLRRFERDRNISPVVLLGHVMAHEIGHLLGLNYHSNSGIMQAAWDEDQLRQAERGELLFSAEDRAHFIAINEKRREGRANRPPNSQSRAEDHSGSAVQRSCRFQPGMHRERTASCH